MASFVAWRKPIVNEHQRLFMTPLKCIRVGTGVGTFLLGETITGQTSGATAALRAATPDSGGFLPFLPTSGTFQSGETLIGSTSGATAPTLAAAIDHTLSVDTVRTRASGALSSYWGALRSDTLNRVGNPGTYTDAWYSQRDSTYMMALPFCALVDPSLTEVAARARTLGLYLAGLLPSSDLQSREWAKGLATIYDLLFYSLSSSDRSIMRAALARFIQAWYQVNPAEFLHGTAHGDGITALFAAIAILEDGTPSENALWASQVDALMDAHDIGASNASFLAGYRYFGDEDGGGDKGSGPTSYYRAQQLFYTRLFPALQSGLWVNWHDTEQWWRKYLRWALALWRPDGTTFRRGEVLGQAKYHIDTNIHAIMTAGRENNSYGQHCAWLADQIELDSNSKIFGPYHLWNVLYRDPTRVAERPTVTTWGGIMQTVFRKAGLIVQRVGWQEADPVLVHDLTDKFTGGHTKRRVGCFQMAAYGKALLYDKGSYDPNQGKTYKDPASATETGHRVAYARRIHSAGRAMSIYDSDEPSENALESFQRSSASSSRIGVLSGGSVVISNDGGQRWPKGAGNKSQPDSLADLLATANWGFDSFEADPVETSQYCYAVGDLQKAYYASKCTKHIQHVLMIKPGQIPGWPYAVWLVVDDMVTHVDSVRGKKTQLLLLNTEFQMTGAADSLVLASGGAKLFHRVLKPSSVEVTHVQGPVIEGETFTATNVKNFDDPPGWRAELNPASLPSGTQEWVTVLFPVPAEISAPPTLTLVDNGTELGFTALGITAKVKKAAAYAASVGGTADTTPPGTPSGYAGTPGPGRANHSWTNPGDSDLEAIEVWRSDPM